MVVIGRYRLKNIVTYWHHTVQSNQKIAWLLDDLETHEQYGYTFDEAWDLIREFGAENVDATIRKTPSREIKELVPHAPQPSLLSTSWQLKYEDAQHVIFSPSVKETMQRYLYGDEKWKLQKKKRAWHNSMQRFTEGFRTYPNVVACIDIAHTLEKANNIIVYVGSSIWNEEGLEGVYASNDGVVPERLEHLFVNSIQTALSHMDVNIAQEVFQFIEVPYVFEFLNIVRSLNPNVQVLFETAEGVFGHGVIDDTVDVVMAIGTELPKEMFHVEQAYYVGHNDCQDPQRYKVVFQTKITQALQEIEGQFIRERRPICGVCGKNVGFVGGSSIAPTTISICIVCHAKGTEPYGVIVTKAAMIRVRFSVNRLGPYATYVKNNTLELLNISEEQFEADAEKEAQRLIEKGVKPREKK